MPRVRAATAALLLAFLAAASALPALAAGAARKGCHCPVRMACCENGTCAMTTGDAPPADGPEWRSCRREAPSSAASPLDSYERALKSLFEWKRASAAVSLHDVPAARLRAAAPRPATPPPRLFSF